jgi:hypothetical protein
MLPDLLPEVQIAYRKWQDCLNNLKQYARNLNLYHQDPHLYRKQQKWLEFKVRRAARARNRTKYGCRNAIIRFKNGGRK